MFVIAIDVSPLDGAQDRIEWRFFDDYQQAEDHWYRANAFAHLGKAAKTDRGLVAVLAVRLYEITSAERSSARELVEAGKAITLMDSEKPESLEGLDL